MVGDEAAFVAEGHELSADRVPYGLPKRQSVEDSTPLAILHSRQWSDVVAFPPDVLALKSASCPWLGPAESRTVHPRQ